MDSDDEEPPPLLRRVDAYDDKDLEDDSGVEEHIENDEVAELLQDANNPRILAGRIVDKPNTDDKLSEDDEPIHSVCVMCAFSGKPPYHSKVAHTRGIFFLVLIICVLEYYNGVD